MFLKMKLWLLSEDVQYSRNIDKGQNVILSIILTVHGYRLNS